MAEEGRRLLVAEDNRAEAHIISFVLGEAGFSVTVASDGQTAWELLDTHDFDLVVTDFTMPGMNGGELCVRMRNDERFAKIPIILLTARSVETDSLLRQSEMLVDAIVSKPFSPRKLKQKVCECLEGCATGG